MLRLLPTLNACLNALSGALLLAGWRMIRLKRIEAHKACMLGAVASSSVFLACYLYYHFHVGSVRYHGPWRPVYLGILLSHTVLAAAVVPLVWRALSLALRQSYEAHAVWGRRLLPVWLYVSVTGVVIYAMLYHL